MPDLNYGYLFAAFVGGSLAMVLSAVYALLDEEDHPTEASATLWLASAALILALVCAVMAGRGG